eukprot:5296157-Amphidinium_carterae.1
MARADLCNEAWDFVLLPDKAALLKEAQDLAAKGLLFWKGRGTVPPELAPCEDAAEEENPELGTEEDVHDIIADEFAEDDEPEAAAVSAASGKAPLSQARRLMALRLVYGPRPPQ